MVATIDSGKKLAKARVGMKGMVSHFTDQGIASKLMAMGILPGTEVQMLRYAPFGGGCYVKADNLLIALRKQEACSIVLR